MTKLYFVNRFILQFFFIRLTRHKEFIVDDFEMYEISLIATGKYGISGEIKKSHFEQWFSIQYWVVPFTGWSTDYKYLNKKAAYLRLTKNKPLK